MITLTLHDGRKTSLWPVQITDASVSQAWHGIRSNVQTGTGNWVEVQETRKEIVEMMSKVQR